MELTLEQKKAIAMAAARQRAAQAAPAKPAARESVDTLQDVQGLGQRVFKGQTLGFGDEIAGAARAGLDYVMPGGQGDQSFADRYRMYRDDARNTDKAFEQKSPGTAMVAELVGNIASPAGLIMPGAGATGSTGARLTQAVARGAAEGGIYGLGSGEGSAGEQLDSASTGMLTGGLTAGAFNSVGGALGRTLSKRRVEPTLRQADGTFKPIHIAAPETGAGRFYRDWLASIPGAKGVLKAQEAPFLKKAADDVAQQEGIFNQQANNLDRHQWHRANDIDLAAQREGERIQAAIDAERLNAAQAQDVAAANNTQTAIRDSALLQQANNNQFKAALKAAVPESRRDTITETGHAGYRQAKAQINEAYADAWGNVSGLANGTINAITDMARFKADSLPADSAAVLKRLGADMEKLGEADNVAGIDDKLRRLIKSTKDHQLMGDLKEIRETLRLGLPDEHAAKLAEVDAVYPAFLATQKAAAKAVETGGVPTRRQLIKSAAQVAGERRTASEKLPLLDVLKATAMPDTVPAGAAPKRPTMERSLALVRQKRELGNTTRAAKKDAATIAAAEKAALKEVENTGPLAKARAAQTTMDRAKSAPHSTAFSALATTGALGSVLTGGVVPYAAGLGVGMGAGRALVSKAGQEFVAGQTKWQRDLAEALRKGDTARYTQLLSRYAAGQATGD